MNNIMCVVPVRGEPILNCTTSRHRSRVVVALSPDLHNVGFVLDTAVPPAHLVKFYGPWSTNQTSQVRHSTTT